MQSDSIIVFVIKVIVPDTITCYKTEKLILKIKITIKTNKNMQLKQKAGLQTIFLSYNISK